MDITTRILLALGVWAAISTALLLVAKLATAAVRANAALRHVIWLTAFSVLLLVPALSLVLPTWTTLRVDKPVTHVLGAPHAAALGSDSMGFSAESLPHPTDGRTGEAADRLGLERSFGSHRTTTATQALKAPDSLEVPRTRPVPLPDPKPILIALWAAGLAVVILRAAIAWRGVLGLHRNSFIDTDSSAASKLANALGIKRSLSLRINGGESPPTAMTWGAVRPVVLLPRDSGGWSEPRRRAVLLHELAHVRRLDSVTQLISLAVCALFWFNPLVWICASAMRDEAETAADDAVLSSGVRPTDYASELVRIAAELGSKTQPFSCIGVSVMKRSKIESRVKSILDPANRRRGPTFGQVSGVGLGGLFLVFLLTCVRPSVALRQRVDQDLYEESLFVLTQRERSDRHANLLHVKHRPVGIQSGSVALAMKTPNEQSPEHLEKLVAESKRRDEAAARARNIGSPVRAMKGPDRPKLAFESPLVAREQAERRDADRTLQASGHLLAMGSMPVAPIAPAVHPNLMVAEPVRRHVPVLAPLKIQDENDSLMADVNVPENIPDGLHRVQVTKFSRIREVNQVVVRYVPGPSRFVLVPPGVTASVEDGTLVLSGPARPLPGQTGVVEVTNPYLWSAELNNQSYGDFQIAAGAPFTAQLNGTSNAHLEGAPASVYVDLQGGSSLQVSDSKHYHLAGIVNGRSSLATTGTIDRLNMQENGSSRVQLQRLAAASAFVAVDGSSMFAAKGSAAKLSMAVNGSSQLDVDKLNAVNADLTADGCSTISLGSADCLKATASGGAHILYGGKPFWMSKTEASGAEVRRR